MTVLVTCEACGQHRQATVPSSNRCDKCREGGR